MSTISLRVSEEESKLIKAYIQANGLNLSTFARELILDKIEEDLTMDEARILNAKNRIKTEKAFDHEEVWERLGV